MGNGEKGDPPGPESGHMSEKSFTPDWFSRPSESLKSIMKKRGITPSKMESCTGYDRDTVRKIILGEKAIDAQVAVKLSKCVGGEPAFWLRRQELFESALDRAAKNVDAKMASEWIKNFPHKNLDDEGWISKRSTRVDQMKEYLAFFGVTKPSEWHERYSRVSGGAFRHSPSYDSKVGALSAWLRRAELESECFDCRSWDPSTLRDNLASIRTLAKAKAIGYILPRLQDLLATAGVALIPLKAPVGCRASGAARFVSPTKAMIVMSFRHRSDDHFWFTLFHEIGHLLLHSKLKIYVDDDYSGLDEREREANVFAANILVPPDRYEEMLALGTRFSEVIRFAVSIGVSPGIVVGQMQHHKVIGREKLNYLKNRYDWDEINIAKSNL